MHKYKPEFQAVTAEEILTQLERTDVEGLCYHALKQFVEEIVTRKKGEK